MDVKGTQESSNQLKSTIDSDMLVGRNKLIAEIVRFLNNDESRLLHIYGKDGHGKSDIANYSGKYALYGRVSLEGAIYIDLEHKNTVNGVIQKICKRLSEKIFMPEKGEYTKEDLIGIIHSRKLLFIIDKCRYILESSKDPFKMFLDNVISQTLKSKFIVITAERNDIETKENIKFKQHLEIPELSRLDAARLLMISAKESKHLSKFKSDYELS